MAITNRNQLIREVYQLLNKEGFETSNIYEQSCFDIVDSTFESPREY